MENVTLSLNEDLLRRSKEFAQRHGKSLDEFIRELLEKNIKNGRHSAMKDLLDFAEKNSVSSGGYKWNREDAYEKE